MMQALLLILVWFVLSLVLSVPVMFLWDWLMPTLFGLPEITLLQTLGLLVLVKCFFAVEVKST